VRQPAGGMAFERAQAEQRVLNERKWAERRQAFVEAADTGDRAAVTEALRNPMLPAKLDEPCFREGLVAAARNSHADIVVAILEAIPKLATTTTVRCGAGWLSCDRCRRSTFSALWGAGSPFVGLSPAPRCATSPPETAFDRWSCV
jgi:hypothetical protein